MKTAKVDQEKQTVEIDGKTYKIGEEVKSKASEERFWELMEGYETKTDFKRYPGRIFFFNKDNEILMEYKMKSGEMLVHSKLIWSVLKVDFSYKHEDVKVLVKNQVEKHFNLRDVTPRKARWI